MCAFTMPDLAVHDHRNTHLKEALGFSTSDLLPFPSSASIGLHRATVFTEALPAAVIAG
jgi:hypothetical protein